MEKKKELTVKQKELIMYVAVGSAVGLGFILGKKHQRRIMETTMFPLSMSIPEIKEALKLIEGAEFADALVVHVNGIQRLLVR